MKFEMFRGDSRDQPFAIKYKSNGNPVNLTGAQVRFTVRQNEDDVDFAFQYKNLAAGGSATQIEMTDAVNGQFTVHINSTDTAQVQGNQRYWYDVEIILAGKTTTVVKDRVLFKQDITY
jgi:hypothetical protein